MLHFNNKLHKPNSYPSKKEVNEAITDNVKNIKTNVGIHLHESELSHKITDTGKEILYRMLMRLKQLKP